MKLTQGVEWALHTCLNLGWLEDGEGLPGPTARRLAAFYDLPPAYLNKQLQSLTRAGILDSVSGPKGGFRLARGLADISVLDVVAAVEGRTKAFQCQQILRQGPNADPARDYRITCAVAQTMNAADLAWRRELAGQTLDDIRRRVEKAHPATPDSTRRWFAGLNV